MSVTAKKKTICLNMIVKNEAHIIADTLEHLHKFIKFDYWVISDTGSTDKTKEIITAFFKKKGIPGKLVEHEWKDFGFNRSAACAAAFNKSDYIFVWDADDEISGDFVMPTNLTADSYKFIFGNDSGFRYSRGQLFNNRKRWIYKGVLHEYADCLDPTGPMESVLGNYYFISGRKGDRSKDPNKYLKDALVLEKGFAEAFENKDHIYNRYAFYCAQSYASCNMHEKAIEWYKKSLTLNLWIQERYICCLEIYEQYDHLKRAEEGLIYLVESYKYDTTRVECIYRIIKHYCIHGPPEVAYMYYTLIQDFYENKYLTGQHDISDKLFAKKDEHDFYLPYYMVIVAERAKHLDVCGKMYDMISRQQHLFVSEWWIRNLVHNIQFCIESLPKDIDFLQRFLQYIDKLIKRGVTLEPNHYTVLGKVIDSYRPLLTLESPLAKTLMSGNKESKSEIRVMVTITSCKRFDLFEKTMNSILHTWSDIDKVDYFLCVDDNSTQRDRSKMAKAYPFFNFYMKTAKEKGHRKSMNIIYDTLVKLKPKYWIHLEDDWLFFQKDAYIEKSIRFLETYESKDIHQILFNRNYTEVYDQWSTNGGEPLEPGFTVHLKSDNIPGRNCGYWPHYSFRPSMVRVKTILELGNYDSPNTFFERDYADKYFAKGYKSGFYDTICSLHIGKLTSDKTGTNAYTLNNAGQFGEAKKPNSYIINLIRRTDRKEAIETLFEDAKLTGYEFYEAIDGQKLIVTDEITNLFLGNDFGNRKGVIGCALSHYTLWNQLIEDTTNEYYIIYEDDITLSENYSEKLTTYTDLIMSDPSAIDMLFLGYHVRDVNKGEIRKVAPDNKITTPLNNNIYIGGFYSYIITKHGAKKMLDYIKENRIKHGIDYLVKIIPGFISVNAQPHIVFSDWVVSHNSPVDTDIQKDYSSLQIVPNVNKDDWEFYEGVDSGGGDIRYAGGKSLDALFIEAESQHGCVAFNTIGYLKSKAVLPFKATPWVGGSGSGIYVKKSYKPSVDVSSNWVSSKLQGGLGNRLFQISAALGLAEKTGMKPVFYLPASLANPHQATDTLYKMFPKIELVNEPTDLQEFHEEDVDNFTYTPFITSSITKSVLLHGYRQSPLYFPSSGINPRLHELLDSARWMALKTKYNLLTEKRRVLTWFVHIRLGDYVNNNSVNHITVESYHSIALKNIPSNAYVLVFSDEPTRVSELLKPYTTLEYQICDEKDEIECLSLMSQCWGGAIVPNSTFSWWGAYFARLKSPNPSSFKAYYPDIWRSQFNTTGKQCIPSWGTCIPIHMNTTVDINDWEFHCGYDSGANDIHSVGRRPINEILKQAALTKNCVAFNTLGFLKSNVTFPLIKSPYYTSQDSGIYIKKSYQKSENKLTRVKMICNWCSSKDLCDEWVKMSKGNYIWNSIQITWEDTDIDYYVIINKPKHGDSYVAEKTIIFHMEPWCSEPWQAWGVKTWGVWSAPDPTKYLQVRSHDKYFNTGFWQLNLTYKELKEMNVVKSQAKGNIISSICSSKYFDPGHKKRIDFMKFIEQKADPNVQLHIYNEDNQHNFKSYVGKADPSVDKEKGILPYKYYFMCENNIETNFITEKLWESILCETLCFYWGCPNVSDYIDPLAYVQLDMNDFEASFKLIQDAIATNLWEQRLPILKKEKDKILEYYGFFPTIERVIRGTDSLLLSRRTLKTVCFIHSCHLQTSGTEKLDLLLDSIRNVNLDAIIINNIGLPLDKAKYMALDSRIEILQCSDDVNLFEIPTLKLIHEYSQFNPDVKILYLHTKGISYSKSDPKYSFGLDWIQYMLYFLTVNDTTNLLDTYDTLGCNYSDLPLPHYSGNFWWATTKYLKTLSLDRLTDKMSGEWWLLSNSNVNKHVLHNSGKNHFIQAYPRNEYIA